MQQIYDQLGLLNYTLDWLFDFNDFQHEQSADYEDPSGS